MRGADYIRELSHYSFVRRADDFADDSVELLSEQVSSLSPQFHQAVFSSVMHGIQTESHPQNRMHDMILPGTMGKIVTGRGLGKIFSFKNALFSLS